MSIMYKDHKQNNYRENQALKAYPEEKKHPKSFLVGILIYPGTKKPESRVTKSKTFFI